jgi:predicted RNA-binding protein with RPS1 domain
MGSVLLSSPNAVVINPICSHGSGGRKPGFAPSSSSFGRSGCSRRGRSLVVANSYSARRPSERSFGRDRRPSYSPDVSELDIQEQIAQLDLEPHKLLTKGEPNTMQAVIKDVMPVGYFVSLPTGRDGYLPADDLGFTGGLAVLQRLFKEGQEITVRIVCRGGAGREIVSIKKPEFAPPSEQKTIESLRLHFENEKKNRMNPRNRRHQNYNNNNNY